jgi:hypothetical protein
MLSVLAIIATAVASAQTPAPSAAAPVANPNRQSLKACSDQANAKGLPGKARKRRASHHCAALRLTPNFKGGEARSCRSAFGSKPENICSF